MALSNPDAIVTEQRLSDFYQGILPYLGGGGSTHKVYGIHITNNESVPSAKVQYIADSVGMTPAKMNYTTGVFDYGSWADAFFMPRPCMLKYDGTVDYYLDPDDYTKKADGVTASDVANTSYGGNAMMEWPKIWLKIVPDSTQSNMAANIYVADYKADPEFTDWNYHNSAGASVDHFYTSIYNGSLISGKLRSISGQQSVGSITSQQEYSYAQANNPTGSLIWTTETITDIDLIEILLMLISKTTDCQTAFGKGLSENGSESICKAFRTGVQNDKGLFYGTNSGYSATYTNAVKVFGMENWWGLQSHRYVGEVIVSGSRKRKLTYGQEDGSTTTGYNFTADGYVSSDVNAPGGGAGGSYISGVVYNRQGLFPTSVSGSSTTHYADVMYSTNNLTAIPVRGGACGGGPGDVGMFCRDFNNGASNAVWWYNAAPSARPLS